MRWECISNFSSFTFQCFSFGVHVCFAKIIHCFNIRSIDFKNFKVPSKLTFDCQNICCNCFVFVSVDPGRDSLADSGRFVRHFDASFLGVTGREEQLANLASGLGVRFMVATDPDDYRVAHSTSFSIIDPGGHFRGRFRAEADMRSVARELTARFDAEAF